MNFARALGGWMRSLEDWQRGIVEPHVKNFCQRVSSEIVGLGIPWKDGITLYLMARDGSSKGVVVEIGGGFGRSACYLASGSKEAGRRRVWSVDPHTGGFLFMQGCEDKNFDSYPIFAKNVRKLGCDDYVHAMVMTSEKAAREWWKPIRLLLIDGWHPDCARDIERWWPSVVDGGLVVFDDYFHPRLPWVKVAVDELVKRENLELHKLGRLVWLVKK